MNGVFVIINSNFPCESFSAKAACNIWITQILTIRIFWTMQTFVCFIFCIVLIFPVRTSTRCQLAPLSSFPLTAFLMCFFTVLNFDKTKNVSVVTSSALLACQQGSTSTWWESVPPTLVVVPQNMIDGPATTTCVPASSCHLPADDSCTAVKTRPPFPVAWLCACLSKFSRHISVLCFLSTRWLSV